MMSTSDERDAVTAPKRLVGAEPAEAIVAVECGERHWLVPSVDGIRDLDAASAVDRAGLEAWRSMSKAGPVDLRLLPTEADRLFVRDLARRGFLQVAGEVVEPAARIQSFDASRSVTATPTELIEVARALLARGEQIMFRARGRSMRPTLPDGSRVVIRAAGYDDVRSGSIVVYALPDRALTLHRVIARTEQWLTCRGDSASLVDRVERQHVLGIVTARRLEHPGSEASLLDLDHAAARTVGVLRNRLYSFTSGAARRLVVQPLSKTYGGPSMVRAFLRFPLRVLSFLLRKSEVVTVKWRRGIEALWAALFTPEEADRVRTQLYARKSVRDDTALDENIEAGFTLIEEVVLLRHRFANGRVLVVGCGPGRECIAFAKEGHQVVGIDRDPGMLEQGRKLATRHGVDVEFTSGDAVDFRLEGRRFDLVVIFSGLYNMVLPRARRVSMLETALAHVDGNGSLLVTFLTDYVPPGAPAPSSSRTFLGAINPTYEPGDRFLLNESIHVFRHPAEVQAEFHAAGAEIVDFRRDQRSYDRLQRQVRGYAVLRRRTAAI